MQIVSQVAEAVTLMDRFAQICCHLSADLQLLQRAGEKHLNLQDEGTRAPAAHQMPACIAGIAWLVVLKQRSGLILYVYVYVHTYMNKGFVSPASSTIGKTSSGVQGESLCMPL